MEEPIFLYHFKIGIHIFVSIVFFLMALLYVLYPPKSMNLWYGYRTPRSMINQAEWDFANRYASKLMLFLTGAVVSPIALTLATFLNLGMSLLLLFLYILPGLFILFFTEKALKKRQLIEGKEV